MHRRAGGSAVARGQRRDDRGMIGQRLLAQRRRVKVLLDLRPQLAATLLPQRVDDERERAVAGGVRDCNVKIAVGSVALLEIVAVVAHAFDRVPQPRDQRQPVRAERQGADRRSRCADPGELPPGAGVE